MGRSVLPVLMAVALSLAACATPPAGTSPQDRQQVLKRLRETVETGCPLEAPKLERLGADGDYELWRSNPTREGAERLIVADRATGCDIAVQHAFYRKADGTLVPTRVMLHSLDNMADIWPPTTLTFNEALQDSAWLPRFVNSPSVEQSFGTPMLRACLGGRTDEDAYQDCQFSVSGWFVRRATVLWDVRIPASDLSDRGWLVDVVDGRLFFRDAPV